MKTTIHVGKYTMRGFYAPYLGIRTPIFTYKIVIHGSAMIYPIPMEPGYIYLHWCHQKSPIHVGDEFVPSLKLTVRPWKLYKIMVSKFGISFSRTLFSDPMLVSGRVSHSLPWLRRRGLTTAPALLHWSGPKPGFGRKLAPEKWMNGKLLSFFGKNYVQVLC